MSVKAKYIKDLPLKEVLDGSESLLVQDSNGTKQVPLGTIVDEIKQNTQEKIREIESELTQTNAQLSRAVSNMVDESTLNPIHTAFNALNDNVLTVFIPQEEYVIDSPIDFTIKKYKKIRIYSEGAGATIICNNCDGLVCSDVWGDNMVEELILENITIKSQENNRKNVGIKFGNVHNFKMHNVHIYGFEKNIELLSCYTMQLDRIGLYNAKYGLYTDKYPKKDTYGAVNVMDFTHGVIKGCEYGIRTTIGSSNTFRKVDFYNNGIDFMLQSAPIKTIINDCYFENCEDVIIRCKDSNYVSNLIIENNYFGNRLETTKVFDLENVHGLSIKNNTFKHKNEEQLIGVLKRCSGSIENNISYLNGVESQNKLYFDIINSPNLAREIQNEFLENLGTRNINLWAKNNENDISVQQKDIKHNGIDLSGYKCSSTGTANGVYWNDIVCETSGNYTASFLLCTENVSEVVLRNANNWDDSKIFKGSTNKIPKIIRITRFFNAGDTIRFAFYMYDRETNTKKFDAFFSLISIVKNSCGDNVERLEYEDIFK